MSMGAGTGGGAGVVALNLSGLLGTADVEVGTLFRGFLFLVLVMVETAEELRVD